MGFLHSVFCWGSVFVVLVSTLLFSTIGIAHWRLIACLWAIIPAAGAVLFFRSPLLPPASRGRTAVRFSFPREKRRLLGALPVDGLRGRYRTGYFSMGFHFCGKGTRNFQISGRPRGSHGVRRMYGIVSGLLCEISPQNLP